MSLDFDNIVVKVDNKTVDLKTSEVPIMVLPVGWDDIPDKPETFPPSEHDHDERYYTKEETYTKDELDASLAGKAGAITLTASGSPVAFAVGAPVPVADMTVGIEPMQAGTGDPSPENVRHISGWTGCNITRTGKNLVHFVSNNYIYSSGRLSNNYPKFGLTNMVRLEAGQSASFSCGEVVQAVFAVYSAPIISTTSADYFISRKVIGTLPYTYTAAQDCWIVFYINYDDSTTVTQEIFDSLHVQVEVGPAVTDYEPYDAETYTISLGEAGTVYVGSFNVTKGQLTVTHEIVDLGTLNWTRNTSGSNPYFRASLAGTKIYAINDQLKCYADRYKLISALNGSAFASNANNNECTVLSNYAILAIRNDSYTSASDFVTAMDGAQFVYELAEPVSYQLTSTEVTTILGNNSIWADTGDTTVTYRADTKLYIDQQITESAAATRQMIADIANGDLAPKSLASGDLIIVGDELRKATDNIGQGSAITASNSTTATLADVIKALQQ